MNNNLNWREFSHSKIGPLFHPQDLGISWADIKDPCPVYGQEQWHLYGSGGFSNAERWDILHATSQHFEGPWSLSQPACLQGVSGKGIAAPGVIYNQQQNLFHMFVQTEFMYDGGHIEHLVSTDGTNFTLSDTVFAAQLNTDHACVYDPHPAEIYGEKYLVYSAGIKAGRCDLYLSKSQSNTWHGPWAKLGKILSHEQLPHHNQHDHPDYEWGLEGGQLIELPGGGVLLNAVCFLPEGQRGTRQRIFFAISKEVQGPYQTLGPILLPQVQDHWQSGENGHAAGFIIDGYLKLFYQARGFGAGANWRYGLASFKVNELARAAAEIGLF